MGKEVAWDRVEELSPFYTVRLKRHENELSVNFEVIEDIGEGEWVVYDGAVKWDGCVNWTTGKECMAHFCRPEDIDEMKGVFIAIWNLSREMMPGAIYDEIEVPE